MFVKYVYTDYKTSRPPPPLPPFSYVITNDYDCLDARPGRRVNNSQTNDSVRPTLCSLRTSRCVMRENYFHSPLQSPNANKNALEIIVSVCTRVDGRRRPTNKPLKLRWVIRPTVYGRNGFRDDSDYACINDAKRIARVKRRKQKKKKIVFLKNYYRHPNASNTVTGIVENARTLGPLSRVRRAHERDWLCQPCIQMGRGWGVRLGDITLSETSFKNKILITQKVYMVLYYTSC